MTLLLLLSLLIRFVTPVDCVLCATIRLEISVRVQLDLSERHFLGLGLGLDLHLQFELDIVSTCMQLLPA